MILSVTCLGFDLSREDPRISMKHTFDLKIIKLGIENNTHKRLPIYLTKNLHR